MKHEFYLLTKKIQPTLLMYDFSKEEIEFLNKTFDRAFRKISIPSLIVYNCGAIGLNISVIKMNPRLTIINHKCIYFKLW